MYPAGTDPGERQRWVTWDSGDKGRNKVLREGRWAESQHVWREAETGPSLPGR